MKADKIIKNAKIFTADRDNPQATALVVKDGKFVYVGDEAGLSTYEGEVTDLSGKFIMPGIIDSHVHVTMGAAFEYAELGVSINAEGKQGILDFIAENIQNNPGQKCYRFMLDKRSLGDTQLAKEDLDAACPDSELIVLEGEMHSCWVNSRVLAKHGINDDTPDPIPGLSYYVRKDGHVTGNVLEGTAEMPIILNGSMELTDEQIDTVLKRWIDNSVSNGVTCVFDSGIPGYNEFHERVYTRLRELDKQGKLPVYIDGCFVIAAAWQVKEGLEELRRLNREFNTEHLKVHTMKVFMDGTLKIHTAAMVHPYEDTGTVGFTAFNKEELAELIKSLNEEGMDLHLHTVGEAASRVVLDAVELARKDLGDDYHVKVTCSHLWVQDDEDIDRFVKLGVIADFSPWWHSGNVGGRPIELWTSLLGRERASKMYRCKTLWDSGALVTWSSDEIFYGDFSNWSPYLGMEVGMTRWITEKTKAEEGAGTVTEFPPACEKMSIEEMIIGYTINGAKQLGIEALKGSIEAGKDADFLVFDKDLITAEKEGFSHIKPNDVYFCGKKI